MPAPRTTAHGGKAAIYGSGREWPSRWTADTVGPPLEVRSAPRRADYTPIAQTMTASILAGATGTMEPGRRGRLLMRAGSACSAANAGVEQALIRMWQDAEQSRRLPIDTRIALLTANVHASTTAIEVIGTVCDIVGSSIAPAGATLSLSEG